MLILNEAQGKVTLIFDETQVKVMLIFDEAQTKIPRRSKLFVA